MLKQDEVPPVAVFNGEAVCPFPPGQDLFLRRQWFFEKHYAESRWTWDIPFRERFYFTNGVEQYLYFRGEDECPPQFAGNKGDCWWSLEKNHWDHAPNGVYFEPFILFFREWIFEKAAPNSGVNLETSRNSWLEDYLRTAPLCGKMLK